MRVLLAPRRQHDGAGVEGQVPGHDVDLGEHRVAGQRRQAPVGRGGLQLHQPRARLEAGVVEDVSDPVVAGDPLQEDDGPDIFGDAGAGVRLDRTRGEAQGGQHRCSRQSASELHAGRMCKRPARVVGVRAARTRRERFWRRRGQGRPVAGRVAQPSRPVVAQHGSLAPGGPSAHNQRGAAAPRGMTETRRLGKYRLVRRLAVGGVAEVYLAVAEGMSGFEKRGRAEAADLGARARSRAAGDVPGRGAADGAVFPPAHRRGVRHRRAGRASTSSPSSTSTAATCAISSTRARVSRLPLAAALTVVVAVADGLEHAHGQRAAGRQLCSAWSTGTSRPRTCCVVGRVR